MFIKAGADVNKRNKFGDIALRYAAVNGHNQCISLLLNGGADVNNQSEMDRTPLIWAAASKIQD